MLPIHANSTPFAFQEIASAPFCAFQGINSLMSVDCQSRCPHSSQPGGGFVIHTGPTGLPLLGVGSRAVSQVRTWLEVT